MELESVGRLKALSGTYVDQLMVVQARGGLPTNSSDERLWDN